MCLVMPKRNIYVVKFGGSVVSGPLFLDWIRALNEWSKDRAVCIVPGGGVIAEAVRQLQIQTGLDDVTSHEWFQEAMRQIGMTIRACSAIQPKWVRLTDLNANNQTGVPSLWVPNIEEFEFSGLPKDWSVSSDSIALWLAKQINADELILLKSTRPPDLPIKAWGAAGYVDGHFQELLLNVSCDIRALASYAAL